MFTDRDADNAFALFQMRAITSENADTFAGLAEESGLAVALVDEASIQIDASNNNSMCRVLNPTSVFSPACSEYCGKAYERAIEARGPVDYECYAGLNCSAVPVRKDGRQLVAIVGRAFIKAEGYRKATQRAISGDWNRFRPTEFFGNILMTGSTEPIAKLAVRVSDLGDTVVDDVLELGERPGVMPQNDNYDAPNSATEISRLIRKFNQQAVQQPAESEYKPPAIDSQTGEAAAMRSLFNSLMKLGYNQACGKVLDFIAVRYGVESMFWFEIKDNRFRKVLARGPISEKTIEVGITPDNSLFVQAAKRQLPLVLRERVKIETGTRRVLNVFPLTVGGDIRAAVGIEGEIADSAILHSITRVSQSVASQLEILRLREEVMQRDWLSRAVRRFNESLKKIDAEDFWLRVTQVSAELLRAERASLLVRNEKSDRLQAKATIGSLIDLISETNIGDRVARPAMETGQPIVVSDIALFVTPAPEEWRYKTSSFITFPVSIGERRIAVLNFTDRADGEAFNERDIELLQAITPQIAMAIDRATLKDQAGEYQQLSVTDSMTGLLNRRYLQERLSEEIQRSKRHHFAMSLLMVDVDNFKMYNDAFGHLAGDEALRIVANILKENLRGDDVAARYGGEEFAILLPQTSSEEATVIAERIRSQIERTDFPHRKVTVSIGIAKTTPEVNSPDDIVLAADRALYEAKDRGRNNIQIFSDFGESFREKIH